MTTPSNAGRGWRYATIGAALLAVIGLALAVTFYAQWRAAANIQATLQADFDAAQAGVLALQATNRAVTARLSAGAGPQGLQISGVALATTIGDDDCATAPATTIAVGAPVYVVAQVDAAPAGSVLRARLVPQGAESGFVAERTVSGAITQRRCVAFTFTPSDALQLPAGAYTAAIIGSEVYATTPLVIE